MTENGSSGKRNHAFQTANYFVFNTQFTVSFLVQLNIEGLLMYFLEAKCAVGILLDLQTPEKKPPQVVPSTYTKQEKTGEGNYSFIGRVLCRSVAHKNIPELQC